MSTVDKDLLDGAEAAKAASAIRVIVLRGNFIHDKKPVPIGKEVVVNEADVAHLIERGFLQKVEDASSSDEGDPAPASGAAKPPRASAKKSGASGDQKGAPAAVTITEKAEQSESGGPSASSTES